jgi:hypothetical protein
MKYFLLIFFVLSSGCSPDYQSPTELEFDKTSEELKKQMAWLFNANPRTDSYSAMKADDYSFYAFNRHHGISIPVFERECPNWNKMQTSEETLAPTLKYIEGVAYDKLNYEQRKFNAIARIYIEDYNFMIWATLEDRGEFKCPS